MLSILLIFALGQQPTFIDVNEAIGFDYPDADMTFYAVTSFEAQYDDGQWQNLGVPPSVIDANTQFGMKTYKVVPPMMTGNHTVSFRACNSVGCGGGSTPFYFTFVMVPEGTPTNVRKIPR
jgi:hypothetical protein